MSLLRCYLPLVLTALLAVGSASAQVNENTPGYFAFTQPVLEVVPSYTDMSPLNEKPAGSAGHIHVRDGHFVDGHGERIRFLGTNVTFGGALPEKELAPDLAGHLAKYGFNVVRFHHIDGRSAPNGLRIGNTKELDAAQLDKLDWFIYQLKLNGIYVNLNLHVSWDYPGLSHDIPRTWRYGKGLDNFHSPFIELQRDYARKLLTHRNPYTGIAYAEEPAVAFVEINNENSLTTPPLSAFDTLPEPFRGALSAQWHAWLKKKYGTDEALRAVWYSKNVPLGPELLANGDFSEATAKWSVQSSGGAMQAERVDDPAAPGGVALKLAADRPGPESWSLQLHQNGLDLKSGGWYTLRFHARADQPCEIGVSARLDESPWSEMGLYESVQLAAEWRSYEYAFQCVNPRPRHGRVGFDLRNRVGMYHFAQISLRPGREYLLRPGETLDAGTLPFARLSPTDFTAFLADTEQAYFGGMVRYLKGDLGVRALVSGTQASYGGALGVLREATLTDYIDMHGYWEHPRFPRQPWDRNDWNIPNTSMTTSETGGVPGQRAWLRVLGMPFTVSEYDHPAPHDHAAEMMPMYATLAAVQDWDGIYSFSYLNGPIEGGVQKIDNYFTQSTHPAKMSFMPVAAVLFRMGAVKPAMGLYEAVLSPKGLVEQTVSGGDPYRSANDPRGAYATHRRVGTRIDPAATGLDIPDLDPIGDRRKSDTGQVQWTPGEPARFLVNVPAARVAVGWIQGDEITLGDARIAVERAEDGWAAVAVCALDGLAIEESEKMLAVVVGRVENQDMGWNADRTSVGSQWGHGPSVAEGVVARIVVPGRVEVAALDGTGNPMGEVKTEFADGQTRFDTGPQYKTLWYAITR